MASGQVAVTMGETFPFMEGILDYDGYAKRAVPGAAQPVGLLPSSGQQRAGARGRPALPDPRARNPLDTRTRRALALFAATSSTCAPTYASILFLAEMTAGWSTSTTRMPASSLMR